MLELPEPIFSPLYQQMDYNPILSENVIQDKDEIFKDAFKSAFRNEFNPLNIGEIDESPYYIINNNSKESISKIKSISKISTTQSKIFKVTIEKETKSIKTQKRRRSKNKNDNQNIHNKYSEDNILRKVQIHFLNFIIFILNDILKELNYTERFLKIDYHIKKKVSKDYIKCLKTKKISDIVCLDITSKFTTKDKDTNRIIYDKIKDNEILNKLFDAEYLEFFDIYYKSKSEYINFTKFGLEKEVKRSNKTKIFIDLLKKISMIKNILEI